ncbi:MAG: CYTH domain-containing protein [Parcubacteria group bacterium]|jgi:adenylate cyclase class 2
MQIEYEATFLDINRGKMRENLKKAGAVLVRPEFLQKRLTLSLPAGHEITGGWLRVRDEGDKIMMTLKVVDGTQIHNQKEINLQVDNLEEAVKLLETMGCKKKSYQETKRELWTLDGVEITIDEWPFLEPFVEVEGQSEEVVKNVSEKIGFDYGQALFCCVSTLYHMKYGIAEEVINNQTPEITFGDKNPFEN